MILIRLFAVAAVASCALACGADTYCQSGPKYGTQCYSLTDVQRQQEQRPRIWGEPSTWSNGPPPPARFGSTPPPPPPAPYPTTAPTITPPNYATPPGSTAPSPLPQKTPPSGDGGTN